MEKDLEPQVLYMATYPPRECGIATFTKDVSSAIDRMFSPTLKSKILAMNSSGANIYNYPKKVALQISDSEITDYLETARKINRSRNIKIVNIQHEFGIFGGEYGNFLLPFLEILNKPVVLTMHSVLPTPNEQLRKVTREIAKRVSAIIVMTHTAVQILKEDYGVQTKIFVIPHGIPSTTFETQMREKNNLGLKGHLILSSFGMMGPGKGYEYVIESLPEVVKKFPDLLYLIVGETHPVVRKKDGEVYRNFLENKVKELKLEKHVKFYNKYLSLNEIVRYLKATDLYVCSSDNPNQITSGTLVYAMGCGMAVVSTPFLHAKDIVTEERGRLADFKNPEAFKASIMELLSDEKLRREIEKKAYHYTRQMTWSNVAMFYGRVYKEILRKEGIEIRELPRINIKHLVKLTDRFGIIQFAKQATPDINSGYTLDDNARALLTCAMHYEKFREYEQLKLIKTYLDYINYVKGQDGKLYNFVDKNKVINGSWSEDAHGRALWALGYLRSLDAIPQDLQNKAEKIFLESLPAASIMKSPRSIAFTIAGIYFFNKIKNSEYMKQNIKKLGDILMSHYKASSHEGWEWFEPYLTYSNSKLPEALFYVYDTTKETHYLDIAKKSLDFLIANTFSK